MNPTAKLVLHWCLNGILLCATIACLYLGLFALTGTTMSDHVNRFMCVVTGIIFGFFTFVFTRKTITQG